MLARAAQGYLANRHVMPVSGSDNYTLLFLLVPSLSVLRQPISPLIQLHSSLRYPVSDAQIPLGFESHISILSLKAPVQA